MKHNQKNVSKVEGKTMKNLVKKIALSGAILAFAMALFGGATYAYSALTSWQGVGDESLKRTRARIDKLVDHIKTVKDDHAVAQLAKEKELQNLTGQIATLSVQKENLNEQLKNANGQSTKDQVKIGELQSKSDNLNKTIERLKEDVKKRNTALWKLEADATKKITDLQAQVADLNEKLTKEKQHGDQLAKALDDAIKLEQYAENKLNEATQYTGNAVDKVKETEQNVKP